MLDRTNIPQFSHNTYISYLLMKMFTGWQSIFFFFRRNLFLSEPISTVGGAEAHLTKRVAFCHTMS